MKNLLKTLPFVLSIALCITSCKKEVQNVVVDQSTIKPNASSYTPEEGPVRSGSGTPVQLDANGNYITAYGGGINFGTTFTYPTVVVFENNGAPWQPVIGGVTTNTNLISFEQEGNSFVMILGTAIGGGNIPLNNLNAISDFNSDFAKYVNGEIPVMPQLSSYLISYGGNGSGFVVIKGSFVIDTDSPTNVSITDLKLNYDGTVPVSL